MALITTQTGEVTTRIVAPRVELYWNPLTNEGRVLFHMEKMTFMEDQLLSSLPNGTLIREATPMLSRTFMAELPNGQGGVVTVPVTTALLMAGLKAVFAELYDESQEVVQLPASSALPGVTPQAAAMVAGTERTQPKQNTLEKGK